ncbi:MAG: A24 family peptidase [Acidaminococcus sp.]|nr:A24 family peptidase [Acidaminococcus sp.]MCI2099954.1 A24 family peptidase [Acidaminococcus sp.]
MYLLYYPVYFLIGLCMGSFLSLCADRLSRGESLLWPPSHCDRCGARLGLLDLVPLWSYWRSGGRCRKCGVKLPRRLWQQELAAGFLFLLLGLGKGPSAALFFLYFFVSCLLITIWLDWQEQYIYDCILGVLLAGGLVRAIYFGSLPQALLGALVLGILMGGIYLAARGGMGLGDVKLCAVLSIWIGVEGGLWCLFLSSLFGILGAGILHLVRHRSLKEPLPYAPFLCGSALVVYLAAGNL